MSATLATALTAAVDRRAEVLVTLLRELVRARSTLGEEAAAQAIVRDRLVTAGFEVADVDPGEWLERADECAGYPPLSYAGRPCVAGRLRGTDGERSLHLSGHVDVVPAEAPERWRHAPWAGVVDAGRMWGRGAGDMKAGLAAYLIAIEAYLEVVGRPPGDLLFSAVIEEECGGNGMKAVLAAGYDADATLIGEPSGLRLQHAGTGVVWARLTAAGDGAHPAFADPGAADPAQQLFAALEGLRGLERALNDRPADRLFGDAFAQPYRLNVGQLEGGAWPSSLPVQLSARVRLGFGRDRSPAEAQEQIAAAVTAAAPEVRVTFEGFRAPAYCDDLDHDLARTLARAHAAELGEQPARRVLAGTTDARSVAGPCLCYGPSAGNLHGIDEWVDLASVHLVARVVAAALAAWQGVIPAPRAGG